MPHLRGKPPQAQDRQGMQAIKARLLLERLGRQARLLLLAGPPLADLLELGGAISPHGLHPLAKNPRGACAPAAVQAEPTSLALQNGAAGV